MRLSQLGTAEFPIRASALTRLQECSGFLLMQDDRFGFDDGEVGPAAHTGTAVGRMVELYHLGFEVRDAISQTRSESSGDGEGGRPFDRARWEDAEFWFRRYTDDPRNPRECVVVETMEANLRIEIPCTEDDPTGHPIVIVGHPDQIRVDEKGKWWLWDLKSGRAAGRQMLYEYAWQQAAYVCAAEEKWDRRVHVGGILRLRGYNVGKDDPGECDVFWRAPYTTADCRAMLENDVAEAIAVLRAGRLILTPGLYCQWCPGDGPQNCGTMFAEGLERGKFEL